VSGARLLESHSGGSRCPVFFFFFNFFFLFVCLFFFFFLGFSLFDQVFCRFVLFFSLLGSLGHKWSDLWPDLLLQKKKGANFCIGGLLQKHKD
jgi:hypothetical protein